MKIPERSLRYFASMGSRFKNLSALDIFRGLAYNGTNEKNGGSHGKTRDH